MHASDDKYYPLAQSKRPPQPRRAVSKKDFSLPKPYRRQPFSEEPERLTRLQKGMLAFAGLLTTSILAVLALLAREGDHSPEGKVIVAAARLETVEPAEAQLASYAAPAPLAPAEPAIPPALQSDAGMPGFAASATPAPTRARLATKTKAKAKAKPSTRLAAASKKTAARSRAMLAVLAREKKSRPPRRETAVATPAPDPDVALIAAILLLTPAPVPASTPAVALELAGRAQASCAPALPKDHGCAELQKLKP